MPKFSVVIPLYNKEKDIKTTLESLLNQEFKDFEILVVNDGSTDGSENIVKNIDDERIQFFTKKNEGVSIARNYGVEKANYEHIAFLDADDFWYPNHLKNLNTLIEKFPLEKWYATAYESKFPKGLLVTMNSPIMKKKEWFGIIENYFKYSYGSSLVWTSAVCFKKEFFNTLNGFCADITHGEDTDLWIRAALSAPLGFCSIVSAKHNLDASNRTTQVEIGNRNVINLNTYDAAAKINPYLKKFLDINRFSLALFAKLNNENITFQILYKQIHLNNLSKKQHILLKTPTTVLRKLNSIKTFLNKRGTDFSVFK